MTAAIRSALATAARGSALSRAEAMALAACDDLGRLTAAAERALPGGARHPCELLQEGVHPAHQAVPGRVPLLHLRARAAGGRAALSRARGGAGDRARGAGGRLQGGAVHAGRSAGAALRGGARGAGRPRRGVDAALPRDVRGAGAEGDRPAAAPQSRRDGRGLAHAPAQGIGVAGHHAGDGVGPAVRARGSALRLARQGAGGAPCHARGGRPGARCPSRPAFSSASARRGPSASRRCSPSATCTSATATSRRSSSRTSAPSPATRMSGAAEPSLEDQVWTIAVARLIFGPAMNIQAPPNLRPEGAGRADPGRHQRLGRRVAGDAGSRQPRGALAASGRPRARHRSGRPHAGGASGDLSGVHLPSAGSGSFSPWGEGAPKGRMGAFCRGQLNSPLTSSAR